MGSLMLSIHLVLSNLRGWRVCYYFFNSNACSILKLKMIIVFVPQNGFNWVIFLFDKSIAQFCLTSLDTTFCSNESQKETDPVPSHLKALEMLRALTLPLPVARRKRKVRLKIMLPLLELLPYA